MSDASDLETFPFDITDVDEAVTEELLRTFVGDRSGYVEVGPDKYFYPDRFREFAPHLWNFPVRSDDIWVSTFPRSGTTWTQEMVWLIANDLDYNQAEQVSLSRRFPTLAGDIIHDDVKREMLMNNPDDPTMQQFIAGISKPSHEALALIPGRRFIKTHFPMCLLPPGVMKARCKVVYVARNPKDVVVSFYHLCRLFNPGYIGDFDTFCRYFEQNRVQYGPHSSHVKDGWDNRHNPNVLFMFYEDMKKDLRATIKKVATFLGKSLTESDIDRLSSHLSIDNFKKNPCVNRSQMKAAKVYAAGAEDFIRNGQCSTSDWPTEFTPEIIERFQRYIDSTMAETDMRFPE